MLVAAPGHADATIFIYHRFGEEEYPTTNVASERFKEQMDYLAENKYQVIPLSTLVNHLKNKQPFPAKCAVITVDDGYLSTYTQAWPILQQHGFPFTVFIYTKAVDKEYRNFVNWKQLREMAAAGADIQDHGYSHSRFGSYDEEKMTEDEYRKWIRDDFARSRKIMAAQLGREPDYLALPYGEYNSIVLEEVKSLGYTAIFTQDPGVVSNETDILQIPREPILGNDWATMKHFTMVLNRKDLPITLRMPDRKLLPEGAVVEKFGARIRFPERYAKGTYGVYVSELGWVQPKVEDDIVYIENSAPLTRRTNRVMVSAKEKESGRTAIHYWLIIQQQ